MDKVTKIKPSILPGFMELLPADQVLFNKLMDAIKSGYELFGFLPLDTPVIEKSEVLLAKGSGETERQIYSFKKGDNELSLRFDLTVPLARYVSEHFNDLNFPFKRYQIGKVFRGEKAQKGRFREFYQCDIDVIGRETLSFVNDAEVLAAIYFVFKKLDIGKFVIRVNNRKILTGIIEALKIEAGSQDVIRLIDKIEKIGIDKFIDALKEIGVSGDKASDLTKLIVLKGYSDKVLSALGELKIKNSRFEEGLEELKEVCSYIKSMGMPEEYWAIDLTIARGLDYYTGTVYETILIDKPYMGSVCSGGRYDNLAEYYTDQKLPGVGVSIGLTRLFFQLQDSGALKADNKSIAKILIAPLGNTKEISFSIATKLREAGISTEVYTGPSDNLKKILDYANKAGVSYVGIIGEDEVKSKTVTLKNMITGEQESAQSANIVEIVKSKF